MDFQGFQRFSGKVSAFGSYGLPSIAGYRIDPRIATFVAILGVLFLLQALGIVHDHGFTLLAAGPVALLRSLEDDHKKLATERAELEAKAEEAKSFDEVRERLDEIDPQLASLEADISREKARQARIRNAPAVATSDGDGEGIVTPLGLVTRAALPFGQQFLGNSEWQEFVKKHAPNGSFSSDVRHLQSPKIELKGSMVDALLGARRDGRMRAATEVVIGGDGTSAGAFVLPGQSGIYDESYARPLTLLDVVTRGTTSSDSVEYVRAKAVTNNAAGVAESTKILTADEPGGTGGVKPWSTLELERINEPVKTIAHGVPATKRALSDAGQMRTIIDSFLRYGLLEEVEDQIAAGNGAGENFDGIYHVEGTTPQSFDTSMIFTLRRAKTKVRTVGHARPNAIAINPDTLDAVYFEALTSEAPGMAQILVELAQGRLHGLPLVESEAIDVGAPIVADWRLAVLWDREQATIEATSGYMDFFMRNLVAVLGELRAAFGVIRPAAFVIAETGS